MTTSSGRVPPENNGCPAGYFAQFVAPGEPGAVAVPGRTDYALSPIPTTGGSFISNIRRRSDFPTSSPSSSFHSDRIVRALRSTAGLGMVIMISEIIASGSGNGWPCWRKWHNRRLGAERALSDLTQMSDKSGGGRVALSVPSASLSYSRANSSNRNLIARVVTPSATWRARAALRR